VRSHLLKLEKPASGVERRAEDKFVLEEKTVVVEVEDMGVGIPEENLRKVFDPFFTTKGPKGGTGLGLSVTRNIVDMHGGIINMESRVGKGTKVSIFLKMA
jgi:signal transduction histidine kinase